MTFIDVGHRETCLMIAKFRFHFVFMAYCVWINDYAIIFLVIILIGMRIREWGNPLFTFCIGLFAVMDS